MTKKSTYLWGILLTIGIGMLLYHFLCCQNNCCQNPTSSTASISAVSTEKFTLMGKDIDYKCQGNFNFLNSDFKTVLPVADSINLGIEKLKLALQKSQQNLSITGYCLATEKNNSAFENLGLARANYVKNYFVAKGIDAELIDIKGIVKNDLQFDKTTTFGPVDFGLNDTNSQTEKEDFELLKSKINANPLTMYFNTGQTTIDLSVEDRKKVGNLVRYLDNVSDAKIDVIGFTDNVGKAENNIKLGQERADFAKNYLVSNGISAERIISESKGSENPIADNKTADGRAKNRRTEVKIK